MSEAIKAALDCIEYLLESDISNPKNPNGFETAYLRLALANAKKATAAFQDLRAVSSGKSVIVPVEPTEAMMTAGDEDILDAAAQGSIGLLHGHPEHASHSVYRAMISAA